MILGRYYFLNVPAVHFRSRSIKRRPLMNKAIVHIRFISAVGGSGYLASAYCLLTPLLSGPSHGYCGWRGHNRRSAHNRLRLLGWRLLQQPVGRALPVRKHEATTRTRQLGRPERSRTVCCKGDAGRKPHGQGPWTCRYSYIGSVIGQEWQDGNHARCRKAFAASRNSQLRDLELLQASCRRSRGDEVKARGRVAAVGCKPGATDAVVYVRPLRFCY